MSTQRYISTSFWDDGWVQELDPSEKLFYIYLLTNPLTNIAGVYQITDKRVGFDTGFSREVVNELWLRFANAGKIVRLNEWLIIPSWPKHQRVGERNTVRRGVDAVLSKVPWDVWQAVIDAKYQYQYLSEVQRLAYPIIDSDSLSEPISYLNPDSDSDTDTDTNPKAANDAFAAIHKKFGHAPNGVRPTKE